MLGPLRGVVVSQARKQVAKKAKREHYPAPYAILELWQKYDGDPFAAANDPSCSIESLFEHPTTANLIRIFFLQERLKSVGQGRAVRAAPRARGRRRRDGRRHRRDLRDARLARHAAGHRARAPRAGGQARRRALQAPPARPAPRARRARPADSGRERQRRAPRRRADRGDLREPGGEARAVRQAGIDGQARRDPRHQHLEPQARRHRHGAEGSVAAGRHPLLQPGAAAAAGRSRVVSERPIPSWRRKPPPSCARSTSCRCRRRTRPASW